MSSDGIIVDLRKDNSAIGRLRSYSSDLVVQNAGTGLRFNDGNNTIHPVVSAGSVSDNLTDLGLINARFKDLHLGGTVNFGNLSDGTITITGFVDEDNMASNSATLLPTQQSVKAYVDSQISSAGGNGISFEDNEKAQFGDGNDLQIYHDGSNSYIKEAGIGNLQIQATGSTFIKSSDGTKISAQFAPDSYTRLYHNNARKLDTATDGIDISGATGTTFGVNIIDPTATAYGGHFSFDDAQTKIRIGGVTNNTKNSAITIERDTSHVTIASSLDVTGNIEVGDSHLIGDDNFDNLALVSSSGENIIVGASNDIYFTTGATSLSSTGTTKLIVKDSGNIGIGTTSPNNKLTVSGASDGINIVGTNSFVRWNSGNMMIR